MIRKIIHIDETKCNGCGLCVRACHEGALDIIDGKARLTREHFCDGLGDCLPNCPMGAITFEEREAPEYDEAAVKAQQDQAQIQPQTQQWPLQIKLVSANAPFFSGADLLIAADCTAYAYARMHETFMRSRVTVIGCPKLDGIDYTEKLTQIIRENEIRSVTVVRMEVPCCGGIQRAAEHALKNSGKNIPSHVVVITRDGKILN